MKFFQWVKEIKSKSGVLHFKRYAIIESAYFSIYIHKIYEHDHDLHMHSHPWAFFGIILKGSYIEQYERYKSIGWDGILSWRESRVKKPFSIGFGGRRYFHKIQSIEDGPVTSLFFTFGKHQKWYYRAGHVHPRKVESEEYRKLKNEGNLPSDRYEQNNS